MIDEILHTGEEVDQCRRDCDAILFHLGKATDNRWRIFMLADLLTKAGKLPTFEAESWENRAFRTLLGIEARNSLILAQFGITGDNGESQAGGLADTGSSGDLAREHPAAELARAAATSMALSPPARILFIAGDRGGSQHHQIQIPREFHSIDEALRASEHRGSLILVPPILAATHQKLVVAYRSRPEILHFAGHGDDRSLSFLVDQELLVSTAPIIAEKLAEILLSFPYRVKLCVLNTCRSAPVAKHLVEVHAVESAIGWPSKLADANAITFCRTFYGVLGDGLALESSVKLAAESTTSEEPPILFVHKADGPAMVHT